MALMAIGILGIEIFQMETQGTIASGESLDLADYRGNTVSSPHGMIAAPP